MLFSFECNVHWALGIRAAEVTGIFAKLAETRDLDEPKAPSKGTISHVTAKKQEKDDINKRLLVYYNDFFLR